jgi:3-isopropylmalate/(R)-2-methylmalate dehydratase large subunit
MAGMTIVEKIFARNSWQPRVRPSEIVVVDVDTAVMIDMSFLASERRNILKVHDPDKIAVIFDHMVPAPDKRSAEAHAYGRDFVKRFGIKRFHDVGPEQGISHAVVADRAYALPGTVLVCSDSHTCASGAFNCAARGVGGPDLLAAVTTGKTWFRVGETIRYDLTGQLQTGVSAKDVFLHIAGTWGHHTNQNVEFGGTGLPGLSIDARRTLATMGAELSAEFATFEPDDRLISYVRERNPAPFEPQYPDPDAVYDERREIELDRIRPLVALPDAVIRNSVPVAEIAGEPIQQAFIGSCANGTLEDLAEAARVVAGKKVAADVRLLVTPGTQGVFNAALKAGYIGALIEAGAVVTPATCGACFGGHMGILGPGDTVTQSGGRRADRRIHKRSVLPCCSRRGHSGIPPRPRPTLAKWDEIH